MRAVNLLPAQRVEKRQDDVQSRTRASKAIAVAGGVALVLVAAVCAVAYSHGRSDVRDRQESLGRVQSQVAQAQAAAAVSAAAAAAMQSHLVAITSAASGRTAWDSLLDQLSRVMPNGAWLESLQTTPAAAAETSTTPDSTSDTGSADVTTNGLSSSAAAAPAAATVTVTGYARSQATVAQVLDRLAFMPSLSDVSLQSAQRASDKNVTQFTITANMHTAGGNG
jgi:Tfp pilus assembly protein PilN